MTKKELKQLILKAKNGDEQAFNHFFKQLATSCQHQLYAYSTSKEAIKEAFSEAVFRFWKRFVQEDISLPTTNIKGYIFMTAKHQLLDEQRRQRIYKSVTKPIADQLSYELKTDAEFWEELADEEHYEEVLKSARKRLCSKCQHLLHLMIDQELEKPKDLWQPLGCNNARTASTVKSKCLQKLRLEVLKILDKHTHNVHAI